MIYSEQIAWLFLLAIPVACIAWTVTHEEVFREPREWCQKRSERGKSLLERKFFYLFTCEYCFSHYVALAFILLTHFHLLMPGWKGLLIAGFSLVWVANIYMSIFGLLRTDLKKEKTEIKKMEDEEQVKS
jgi:hypothetical protein